MARQTRQPPEWYSQVDWDGLEDRESLPRGTLKAIAQIESGFRADAVGPPTRYGTAKGAFQFIDDTARDYGVDAMDPVASADAAARFMGRSLRNYKGDMGKVLASYNWGSGNMQRQGYENMPLETRRYLTQFSNLTGWQVPENLREDDTRRSNTPLWRDWDNDSKKNNEASPALMAQQTAPAPPAQPTGLMSRLIPTAQASTREETMSQPKALNAESLIARYSRAPVPGPQTAQQATVEEEEPVAAAPSEAVSGLLQRYGSGNRNQGQQASPATEAPKWNLREDIRDPWTRAVAVAVDNPELTGAEADRLLSDISGTDMAKWSRGGSRVGGSEKDVGSADLLRAIAQRATPTVGTLIPGRGEELDAAAMAHLQKGTRGLWDTIKGAASRANPVSALMQDGRAIGEFLGMVEPQDAPEESDEDYFARRLPETMIGAQRFTRPELMNEDGTAKTRFADVAAENIPGVAAGAAVPGMGARTLLGRMGSAALQGGAGAAITSSIQQPLEKRGQTKEHAAQEQILQDTAFGATVGAALQPVAEGVGALWRFGKGALSGGKEAGRAAVARENQVRQAGDEAFNQGGKDRYASSLSEMKSTLGDFQKVVDQRARAVDPGDVPVGIGSGRERHEVAQALRSGTAGERVTANARVEVMRRKEQADKLYTQFNQAARQIPISDAAGQLPATSKAWNAIVDQIEAAPPAIRNDPTIFHALERNMQSLGNVQNAGQVDDLVKKIRLDMRSLGNSAEGRQYIQMLGLRDLEQAVVSDLRQGVGPDLANLHRQADQFYSESVAPLTSQKAPVAKLYRSAESDQLADKMFRLAQTGGDNLAAFRRAYKPLPESGKRAFQSYVIDRVGLNTKGEFDVDALRASMSDKSKTGQMLREIFDTPEDRKVLNGLERLSETLAKGPETRKTALLQIPAEMGDQQASVNPLALATAGAAVGGGVSAAGGGDLERNLTWGAIGSGLGAAKLARNWFTNRAIADPAKRNALIALTAIKPDSPEYLRRVEALRNDIADFAGRTGTVAPTAYDEYNQEQQNQAIPMPARYGFLLRPKKNG